jgi:hypothetical protein
VEIVQLPPIKNGKVLPVPTKVLKARLNRGDWQILVQWVGRPVADATWEMVSVLQAGAPGFPAQGRAVS